MENKLGVGDFDEGGRMIHSLFENDKGSGTVQSIAPYSTIGGGSAMPLCGIVLPPSKNQRKSANMLLSVILGHKRHRVARAFPSAPQTACVE